jgi:hypothetical protein
MKRYPHVPGECATPNSNHFPDGTAIRMNLEVLALYAHYLDAWFGGFPNDRSRREE